MVPRPVERPVGSLKTAVSDAVDWIKTHWELLVEIITGPLGIIVGLVISNWDTIKNTIIAAVSTVKNVLYTAWNLLQRSHRRQGRLGCVHLVDRQHLVRDHVHR